MAAIGSSAHSFAPGPNTLVAGRDFPINNRVALNAAAATGKNLYFPNTGVPYTVNGPVYLCGYANGQTVQGEAANTLQFTGIPRQADGTQMTQAALVGDFMGPVVVLGNPANLGTPKAGTYVNLGSWLDSSCNASSRYGLRVFNGQQKGAFCSDGFQLGGAGYVGDWWQGSTYTISFAFLPYNSGSPSNPFTAGALLLGMGDCGEAGPYPWPWTLEVAMSGGSPIFSFCWNDETAVVGERLYSLNWPMPSVTGVIRLYIMVDINRTQFTQNITVYQDSGSGPKQVAYMSGYSTGTAGVPFSPSFFYPFSFGYVSQSFDNTYKPGVQFSATDDWVLCGLHVENALTYKDNGSGTLVTQSGAAITDEFAFFTPRSSTAALLPLTYQGSPYAWEIPTQNAYVNGYGFMVSGSLGGTFGSGFANLTVFNQIQPVSTGTGIGYGDAIAVMNCDDLTIENVSAMAGASAIRGWAQGSTLYYQRYRNLQLGAAIPLTFANASANLHNIEMQIYNYGIGVYAIGSELVIHQLRVPTVSENAKNIIWHDSGLNIDGAGSVFAEDIVNDNEGNTWPTDCYVRLNECTYGMFSKCYFTTVYPGDATPIGSPGVALGKINPSMGGKGVFSLDTAFYWAPPSNGSSVVRVEDPNWDVRIVGASTNQGVHGILHDVSGGCTAYVEQLDCGPVPPRYGHAYQGMHLSRCNPVPGQYAEWRCVRSGSPGTATVPMWVGYYPAVVPGSNECAAYCLTYLCVSNPAFDTAFLFDTYINELVAALFGSASWTPPGVAAFGYASQLFSRASSLVADSYSPEVQMLDSVNPQYVTGGTYTLSYNGSTTAPIPYNTPCRWSAGTTTVSTILQGIGCNCIVNDTSGNNNFFTSFPVTLTFQDNAPHPLITINTSGLTTSNTPFSMSIYQSTPAGNYSRVATTWTTPANGSASNTAAIAPPTSTGPWNGGNPLMAWHLNTATTAGSFVFGGTFATTQYINASGYVPPSYAAGSIVIQGTPSNQGGLTNFAIDQILAAILQATPFTPPSTWYIGLSSTPINASGTGLAEPSGGGYARVAVANTASNWNKNQFGARTTIASMTAGFACNVNALTFPTPTAAWSSGVSLPYWFLADASTGGNIWASGTIPVAPVVSGSTSPAPSFAPGAFVVQLI